MNVEQKGYAAVGTLGVLVYLGLIVIGCYGWVLNIVEIAHSDFTPVTGLLVLRLIGIFVAPLGAVLGFV